MREGGESVETEKEEEEHNKTVVHLSAHEFRVVLSIALCVFIFSSLMPMACITRRVSFAENWEEFGHCISSQ